MVWFNQDESLERKFHEYKYFYDEYYDNNIDIAEFLNSENKNSIGYKGSYIILNAGMGCSLYVKCDYNKTDIFAFFLHSDCQGQYSSNLSLDLRPFRPFRDLFIENYDNKTIEFHNLIKIVK